MSDVPSGLDSRNGSPGLPVAGDALLRCRRQVEGMKTLGRALGSGLDLDDLLPRLVAETTRLLDAERSTLFVADNIERELWSRVLEGWPQEIRLPFGRGLAGWVAEHRRVLRVEDAYLDPRFDPATDLESGFRTRSVLAVPVHRPDGTLAAVIQVLNGKTPFGEEDEELLEAIGSEVGVLLESALLYQTVLDRNRELSRAHAELSLLYEVERIIGDGDAMPLMLQRLLGKATESLSVRGGVIWLLEGSQLRVAAASSPALQRLRKAGPAETVVRDGAFLIGKPERPVRRDGKPVRSQLMVPIPGVERRAQDRPVQIDQRTGTDRRAVGVLELFDRPAGVPFDESDLRTVHAVASRIGRAVWVEAQRLARIRAERLAAVGQALSGIVHDLRTPLTVVKGMATQLEEDLIEPHGAAVRIHRQVDRIDGMTRELLAFVRGDARLQAQAVELADFADRVAVAVADTFAHSEVDADVQGRVDGEAVLDGERLLRVFENLARNSREAMGRSGRFCVRFESESEHWTAEVEDDGPGVPEAIRDQMFEAFTTAGKAHGTGLGLAMARQVVQDHGGTIELVDGRFETADARGACFRLRFPRGP